MATKKSTPKKKNNISPRNFVFYLVAIFIITISFIAYFQELEKQKLERKDSDNTKVAEKDINKVHAQLNKSAGAGEWGLDKRCENGTCHFDIKPLESDANAAVADLKSSITKVGSISSEDKKEDSSKGYIGFKLLDLKIECDAYYTKKDQLATQIEISCTSPQ